MLLAQAPAGSSGACVSQLGRELLSQLAAARGFHCPVGEWSPRGKGAPQHPALPSPWKACLAHRDLRVIAGLATVPVGIDIEHARARHQGRVGELVELLPETDVRHAIRRSAAPLAAFYQAWTLHEALFKLDSLSGSTHGHVLETRLSRLLPGGDAHAWQWQQAGWTLSICCQCRSLDIRCLPSLPLRKTAGPLCSIDISSPAVMRVDEPTPPR
ncbi:MAG: Phosphopantetheinyl transferase [Halomonas sp. HL-48]|nr:MAG: Phosphopantetheinyl transferase [Halomonas sp. HL-48]